jgi:hypothetical protein
MEHLRGFGLDSFDQPYEFGQGEQADQCSQIRTRRLTWDAAGKGATLPYIMQYTPCSTKDLCIGMRDDKGWRPAKWVSDARQRASALLAIGERDQRLGREETQAGEQTAHACGVARALICFHSLMLRDFVALISPMWLASGIG